MTLLSFSPPREEESGERTGRSERNITREFLNKHYQSMPKLKTKSSAKKRFKLTASGKIKRKHAFKSHILTKKETKRKHNLTKAGLVDAADMGSLRKQLCL